MSSGLDRPFCGVSIDEIRVEKTADGEDMR